MLLDWFDAREASDAGRLLAESIGRQFAPSQRTSADDLQESLRRAVSENLPRRLNVYKKAKLASSFRWRLSEIGVDAGVAGEMSQILAMQLSASQLSDPPAARAAASARRPAAAEATALRKLGEQHIADGDHARAVEVLERLLERDPDQAEVINSLGAALFKLDRYAEAEQRFREAVLTRPDHHEAQRNLGTTLRIRGQLTESEIALRRALTLAPNDLETRNSLGWTLLQFGHIRAAEACFRKILKYSPRHVEALLGMGQALRTQGRFDEAEALYRRALKLEPSCPGAWAAMGGLRKMTAADAGWLRRAEEICAGPLSLAEKADMLFAIGKYCDDTRDYGRAFRHYQAANQLVRSAANPYDRVARTHFVDDMIRAYPRRNGASSGVDASDSVKPVFVVGMMRSGTTLVEQIIASHPEATGFGERGFWDERVRVHARDVRGAGLAGPLMRELAGDYLRTIDKYAGCAARVVDKAPVNSDYLGLINSIFPRARIINMRRDPIDTCLSCYFQHFSAGLSFTMDLADLAHYHGEHSRLVSHWRAVLPQDSILDVPYEELVADQEKWTRKILDFIGLEWDPRCLKFYETSRRVNSASLWQVRQPMQSDSVARWRHYERFIGPLLGLRAS